ncbi:hypothetical protein V5799_033591 [Amblyomma americanum]|uniref:Peptidase M13 C-terminal domain-containing protein n=1 Tax=Amblyomma americanum TaxID=6943 RepID=A0AAQ4DMW6_AMBAM
MRSSDDGSSYKDAKLKGARRAMVPAETTAGSHSQAVEPNAAATAASQPPSLSSTAQSEKPPKRRRQRSSGQRGSRSSSSRSSSSRSSTSQEEENAEAAGTANMTTEAGSLRRRKRRKERDVSSTPVRPQGAPRDEPQTSDVLGIAMRGGARADSNTANNKPAQEATPPASTAATGTCVGEASSNGVVGLEFAAQGPPEGGEMKSEVISMVSALSQPVLRRGTRLVAMAATAVDVPGVMANIEAAAPQAAVEATAPMDACDAEPMQDAAKMPSFYRGHTSRAPDKECTVPQWILAALALCLPCVLMLLFVFVVLPLLEKDPVRKTVCDTRDCVLHANALRSAKSQAAAKACEDIGLLVCSTWANRHRGLAWAVVPHVVMDWIVNIEDAVATARHESDVMKRPMRLVHSCLNRQGNDKDAVISLIHFVHNKSFAWPTEEEGSESLGYSRALVALIELAVRWALPLWFRIDLLPSRAARNRTLTVKPSAIPIIWEILHGELLSNQDVYPSYLHLFHEEFFVHRTPTPTYQEFLVESAVIQSHVLGNLSHANRASIFVPTSMELEKLPSLIPQLKADDWAIAVQSAFNVSPPIEIHDVLLATNGEILAAVSTLLDAYDARSIVYHTSWWFLQMVGIFASNQLFNYASVYKLGAQFQKIVCAIHIEATDYLLLAAVSQAKFASEQRRSIKRYLEHVHSTAVEKVRTSSKIRSPVKGALLSMLQRTTAVTWPEDAFVFGKTPSNIYTNYVSSFNDSNIFSWWRSLREALQPSVGSEQHAAVNKLPRLDTRTVTWYDPVLEVMSISFAALVPPLYYKSGTSAMLYGGLGYIYAREVVQAVNFLTMLLDDGGDTNRPSEGAIVMTLGNNVSCPDVAPSAVELMFPSLPALEIAYAAYVTYRDEENDLPLKGLEKYSAEQIFFLTFCLMACEVELSGRQSAPFCNSAVKNFEPFAKAFSCRPGSNMNPGVKCRFFEG